MNEIVRHKPGPNNCWVVEYGNLVFIAGIQADNTAASCKAQTEEVLKKIESLMALAGTNKSKIVSANVWVADIREKGEMDAAWQAWIDPDNKPARATVESRLSKPDARVEIMMVAVK